MQSAGYSPKSDAAEADRSVASAVATGVSSEQDALIVGHLRRLREEAESFYASQQQLLMRTYGDLSQHVDQLKYRAQFFVSTTDGLPSSVNAAESDGSGNRQQQHHGYSVPMPLTALTGGNGGGYPFGAGAGVLSDASYDNGVNSNNNSSALNATPLRPTLHNPNANFATGGGANRFGVSPLAGRAVQNRSPNFSTNSFQVSGSNDALGGSVASGLASLSGATGSPAFMYTAAGTTRDVVNPIGNTTAAAAGAIAGAGTSTPPSKHLVLTADSKSPSLSTLLEDNLAARASQGGNGAFGSGGVNSSNHNNANHSDWGSLSLANNASGSLDNTQYMMASPQFTNTLSLDELLARFVGHANTGGGPQGDALGGSPGFSFDTLYEQLIGSGEKSRSPDNAFGFQDANAAVAGGAATVNGKIGGHVDVHGGREVQPPSSGGFAVTSGDAGNFGGRPVGGSLFDRNTDHRQGNGTSPLTPAAAATAAMAGDRFTFGSATRLFSTSSHTPSKQTQLLAQDPQQHQQRGRDGTNDAATGVTRTGGNSANSTYALLNSFNEKDVIPIDSIRSLCDQHLTASVKAVYECGRPVVVPVKGEDGESLASKDAPATLGIDEHTSCQVLVEFKRKRVLQYDSDRYVSPGNYVVVGGDRGEDLGLVIYTWCEIKSRAQAAGSASASSSPNLASAENEKETSMPKEGEKESGEKKTTESDHSKVNTTGSSTSTVAGIGLSGSTLTRSIGVGNGTVLRVAIEGEVEKLLGVQAELETRAVDACGQRVLDHGLPMVIVDAEYQFDKKKLTFFYEAQQRMDFRDLVRDLYKTFRARIWMELVDN